MAQKKNRLNFDGRGLAHLVRGKALHAAVAKVPEEIWSMDLKAIELMARPTTSDRLIKVNMWSLLTTVDLKKGLKLGLIYKDITTQTNFYNYFLKNPYKVAWLLMPSENHELQVRVMQNRLLDKLEDLVRLPITTKQGKYSMANIRAITKAVQVLFGVYDKI